MRDALYSINPEFVKKIFSGEKKYEYRHCLSKEPLNRIFIYETSPTCRIVGLVYVNKTLKDTPEKLWNETCSGSGIESSFYYEYFKNRDNACAYELHSPKIFNNPISLVSVNIKTAPQSFIYLSDVQTNKILSLAD